MARGPERTMARSPRNTQRSSAWNADVLESIGELELDGGSRDIPTM